MKRVGTRASTGIHNQGWYWQSVINLLVISAWFYSFLPYVKTIEVADYIEVARDNFALYLPDGKAEHLRYCLWGRECIEWSFVRNKNQQICISWKNWTLIIWDRGCRWRQKFPQTFPKVNPQPTVFQYDPRVPKTYSSTPQAKCSLALRAELPFQFGMAKRLGLERVRCSRRICVCLPILRNMHFR